MVRHSGDDERVNSGDTMLDYSQDTNHDTKDDLISTHC
jgi:hypothetical protein